MLTAKETKIEIKHLRHLSLLTNEGADVIKGLSQPPKTLPPKYFYDKLGSELFEQICYLPEYYPTRTETAILKQAASEISNITGICELIAFSIKKKLIIIDRNLIIMR